MKTIIEQMRETKINPASEERIADKAKNLNASENILQDLGILLLLTNQATCNFNSN